MPRSVTFDDFKLAWQFSLINQLDHAVMHFDGSHRFILKTKILSMREFLEMPLIFQTHLRALDGIGTGRSSQNSVISIQTQSVSDY